MSWNQLFIDIGSLHMHWMTNYQYRVWSGFRQGVCVGIWSLNATSYGMEKHAYPSKSRMAECTYPNEEIYHSDLNMSAISNLDFINCDVLGMEYKEISLNMSAISNESDENLIWWSPP